MLELMHMDMDRVGRDSAVFERLAGPCPSFHKFEKTQEDISHMTTPPADEEQAKPSSTTTAQTPWPLKLTSKREALGGAFASLEESVGKHERLRIRAHASPPPPPLAPPPLSSTLTKQGPAAQRSIHFA